MRDESLALDQTTEVFADQLLACDAAGLHHGRLARRLHRRHTDGIGLGTDRFRSLDGSHNRLFSHADCPGMHGRSVPNRGATADCPDHRAGWDV